MTKLAVLLEGRIAGEVEQLKGGDLEFRYSESWHERDDSYPLSLSMPLARQIHDDSATRPFLEGLLPDNRDVLKRWARRFHVSERNPFALLTHMGEDCAGAVQFATPDRVERILERPQNEISWLTEDEVGERLRDLVERHGTGRLAGDQGQFSLAGAQPKMALYYNGRDWGVPAGATPTTHILKPPAQADLNGFDVNEHFCLRLAERLGLRVVRSSLETFGDQQAIVVERYDRIWQGDWVRRTHQEDLCQALSVPPWIKYENEGGPGVSPIVNLLAEWSDDPSEDIGTFLDALALNWAIAGTDAHAKNYSILLAPGLTRLAPLYDLASILPYPEQVHMRKIKLAMRVGREYHLWKIRPRHWEDLADRANLDSGPVLQRVGEVVEAVPAAAEAAAAEVEAEGIEHPILDRLVETIVEQSATCGALLA